MFESASLETKIFFFLMIVFIMIALSQFLNNLSLKKKIKSLEKDLYFYEIKWIEYKEEDNSKLRKNKYSYFVQTESNKVMVYAKYVYKEKRGILTNKDKITYYKPIKIPKKFCSVQNNK